MSKVKRKKLSKELLLVSSILGTFSLYSFALAQQSPQQASNQDIQMLQSVGIGTSEHGGALNGNFAQPLSSSGTLHTINGKQSFNAGLSCPSYPNAINIAFAPGPAGGFQVNITFNGASTSGLLQSGAWTLYANGICTNGYVYCPSGWGNSCSFYYESATSNSSGAVGLNFVYVGNGTSGADTQVSSGSTSNGGQIQTTSLVQNQLGACVCVDSSCGYNQIPQQLVNEVVSSIMTNLAKAGIEVSSSSCTNLGFNQAYQCTLGVAQLSSCNTQGQSATNGYQQMGSGYTNPNQLESYYGNPYSLEPAGQNYQLTSAASGSAYYYYTQNEFGTSNPSISGVSVSNYQTCVIRNSLSVADLTAGVVSYSIVADPTTLGEASYPFPSVPFPAVVVGSDAVAPSSNYMWLPDGHYYYQYTFNTSHSGVLSVYIVADDFATLYLNGVQFGQTANCSPKVGALIPCVISSNGTITTSSSDPTPGSVVSGLPIFSISINPGSNTLLIVVDNDDGNLAWINGGGPLNPTSIISNSINAYFNTGYDGCQNYENNPSCSLESETICDQTGQNCVQTIANGNPTGNQAIPLPVSYGGIYAIDSSSGIYIYNSSGTFLSFLSATPGWWYVQRTYQCGSNNMSLDLSRMQYIEESTTFGKNLVYSDTTRPVTPGEYKNQCPSGMYSVSSVVSGSSVSVYCCMKGWRYSGGMCYPPSNSSGTIAISDTSLMCGSTSGVYATPTCYVRFPANNNQVSNQNNPVNPGQNTTFAYATLNCVNNNGSYVCPVSSYSVQSLSCPKDYVQTGTYTYSLTVATANGSFTTASYTGAVCSIPSATIIDNCACPTQIGSAFNQTIGVLGALDAMSHDMFCQ